MAVDRKPGERLKRDEIENLVGAMIKEARSHVEDTLSARRELGSDYYRGAPFGNEEEGRSQVVSTDVRDTIQGMLPSFMRVFFGPERVIEFVGRTEERSEMARQATDYVRYVFTHDNPGFSLLHGALKDSMHRLTGVLKWGWDEGVRVEEAKYTELSDDDIATLLDDDESDDVDVTELETDDDGFKTAIVKRTLTKGRVKIDVVPGDEVSWSESARSLEDARIVVHSREMRMSQLVAMGFDREVLEDHVGEGEKGTMTDAERASRRHDNLVPPSDEEQDPNTRPIMFHEAYIIMDIDGDNIEQRYRIPFVGDGGAFTMLDDEEPISHLPFALFVFDPEPHEIVGQDVVDYVGDVQKIKSSILRGTLDSLNLALIPRTQVVEGMVNLDDLMNTEIGAIVRSTSLESMREIKHSFVGSDSLPVLAYMDEKKENSTGQSKAAAGLDADALQSSTKAAVAATISGSQQHLEMTSRIYAENGLKQLFSGILRTLIENQDRERVVRLRGKHVEVNPKAWDAEMDVIINVALGSGLPEDRITSLQSIISEMKEIITSAGPNNPLTGFANLRFALGKATELAGWGEPDLFWKPYTQEDEKRDLEKAAQAEAQAAQKPDPQTQALIQVETAKLQAQQQKDQAELQLREQKLQLDAHEIELKDDRERDKQAADTALKFMEIKARHESSLTRADLEAAVKEQRTLLDADVKERIAAAQLQHDQNDEES